MPLAGTQRIVCCIVSGPVAYAPGSSDFCLLVCIGGSSVFPLIREQYNQRGQTSKTAWKPQVNPWFFTVRFSPLRKASRQDGRGPIRQSAPPVLICRLANKLLGVICLAVLLRMTSRRMGWKDWRRSKKIWFNCNNAMYVSGEMRLSPLGCRQARGSLRCCDKP